MPNGPSPSEDPSQPKKTESELPSAHQAWELLQSKWSAFLPELPVVLVVLIAGALGGWIAWYCNIQVGGSQLPEEWGWIHRAAGSVFLGMVGSGAAVFLLAKTDTTKVWHCFFFALICGLAGRSFVVKGVEAIAGVSLEEKAAGEVAKEKLKLNQTIQGGIAASKDAAREAVSAQDPKKTVEALNTIGSAATEAQQAAEKLPEKEKENALKEVREAVVQSIKPTVSSAPEKAFDTAAKIAVEGQRVGDNKIGDQIVATFSQFANDTNASNAVKSAARKYQDVLQKQLNISPRLYLITPDSLVDDALTPIRKLLQNNGFSNIEPPVHPKAAIDPGVEVVYYLPEDLPNANTIGDLLSRWFNRKVSVNKAPAESNPRPKQFDIHIGPDVAAELMKTSATPSPPH
jgi:hypothetical protein